MTEVDTKSIKTVQDLMEVLSNVKEIHGNIPISFLDPFQAVSYPITNASVWRAGSGKNVLVFELDTESCFK